MPRQLRTSPQCPTRRDQESRHRLDSKMSTRRSRDTKAMPTSSMFGWAPGPANARYRPADLRYRGPRARPRAADLSPADQRLRSHRPQPQFRYYESSENQGPGLLLGLAALRRARKRRRQIKPSRCRIFIVAAEREFERRGPSPDFIHQEPVPPRARRLAGRDNPGSRQDRKPDT